MPQIVVDPVHHGNPTASIAINLLPPNVRKFGYVPDLTKCKPGDLILSHSRSLDMVDRLIRRSQEQAGFHAEDSRWTHAAVFLYEDFIVEAVPNDGVVTRSLYSDVPDTVLRVRRHANMGEIDRYKVAMCALRMLGLRYSAWGAVKAGWKARSGLWNRSWSPSIGRTIICSKIFFDAHVEITRSLLRDCPVNGPLFPAHLSATADLDDVAVSWLKVETT